VRVNDQWCSATATLEPDGKLSQSATVLTMRAMESDPISVRITYDWSRHQRGIVSGWRPPMESTPNDLMIVLVDA
jgi:hypothetical protein